MNRLGFLIAKLASNDPALSGLSAAWSELDRDLAGRSVALIGNARSLAAGRHGPGIDSADIVIRLNAAPMPSERSHGRRTDWVATSVPIPPARLAELGPSRILWMTPRRKRLPWRMARSSGFYLYPSSRQAALMADVGSRPTTGLMVLDLLKTSTAARIDVFGFDFFQSLSLTGRRAAAQVSHDFGNERQWAEALFRDDARFRLHRPETV